MQVSLHAIDDILVQSLEHEEKQLEMIIVKVMNRPDSLFAKSKHFSIFNTNISSYRL